MAARNHMAGGIISRTKLSRLGRTVGRLTSRIKKHDTIGQTIADIFHPIIYVLLYGGIIAYIVLYYVAKQEPPGFELATISGVIGGLLFSGAFIGGASQTSELQREVKRTGILYLVATIGFIFLALFWPMLKLEFTNIVAKWTVIIVIFLSLIASITPFAWATAKLVTLVPKLWKK
jgi:hypothetical protein